MFKKFIRDLVNYIPSKLLPAITSFISTPIFTRLFLPVTYGNYALATALSDFLYAVSCSGLGSGIFRYYPVYKAKSTLDSFFSIYTLFISVVIIVTSILAVIFLVLFRSFFSDELFSLLLIGVLYFFLSSFFIILTEVLRAQERSRQYTYFQLATTYGGLILSLVLVMYFHTKVQGLLWGNIVILLAFLPLIFRMVTKGSRIHPRFIQRTDIREIWQFAWPLTLGNMAMWGLRLSDRYVIGMFRPESEVGIYSVAYNISNKSIDILVTLFILTMSPMIMNSWVNHGRQETEKALSMITRMYLILGIPAVIGISVLAYPIVKLLTSQPYYDGYKVVSVVGMSSFFWGLTQIANRGLLIGKSTRQFANHQLIAAIFNIALNLFLIPKLGFIAAGVTTLAGYILLFSLQAHASQKYLTWRISIRSLINVLIASGGMGVVIFYLYNFLQHQGMKNFLDLLICLSVGILLYFGTLLVLGEANTNEKKQILDAFLQLRSRAE